MRRLLVLAMLLLATAGCADDDLPEPGDANPDRALTVFAAASLQGAFTEIGKRFEDANPGVTVLLSFAGSSDLVAQIQQGAPADVFASADTATMDKALSAELVGGATLVFATNTLQIVTPPDNPAGIDSLADLGRPGVQVVLCASEVPCGAAAARVQKAADVEIDPVSEEQSVTDVLGKVFSGEADAGLVYRTDVKAAGSKVQGVELPESRGAVNTYPIAPLRDADDESLATYFAEYVTRDDAQSVLADFGFGAP